MAFWTFTPEELAKVLAFVNDENNEVVYSDIAQRFINLGSAFQSKILKTAVAEHRLVASAEKTISRQKVRLEGRVADGTFVELDFDTADIAKCILYISKVKNYYCSRNKLQYLLYEAYSRWLADHNERLVSEHPVVQEWGPHFWTVTRRLGNLNGPVFIEDYKKIAEKNPGVVKFLENVVVKYSTWSDNAFKEQLVSGAPYRNAKPKGGEKWGRQIKDSDIYAWKK